MTVTEVLVLVGLGLHLSAVNAEEFYTRWGRTTCEGEAAVVYTGYMTSSYHLETGNGKNYLCLSSEPQWGNVSAGVQGDSAGLWGVQYAIGIAYQANKPFSWSNFNGQNPGTILAPCVLCMTPHTAIAMIPGQNTCPKGLFHEYNGYLVALLYNQYGTEYICLDGSPEPAGSALGSWQGAFHIAQIRCGALPCSTYPEGNEISCAVCSR